MTTRTINPMRVDYCNLEQVIALAQAFSTPDSPMVVVKHPDRRNYNVTFKSRTDLYQPDEVIWPVE